jgi:hypothetical protein
MATIPTTKIVAELPERVFLYTLDQIATITSIDLNKLKMNHVFFESRTLGPAMSKKMKAHNIAGPDAIPDWRIAEAEFIRWMRACGFRPTRRGWV